MKPTVVLVACSRSKRGRPGTVLAAQELYSASALFRHSLAYTGKAWPCAQSLRPAAIWVLSGKHGLVGLRQRIPYYQLYLAAQPADYRRAWAQRVVERLATVHPDPGRVIILAGATYADPLRPLLEARGWTVEEPLRGLTVCRRLRWLKAHSLQGAS